jgi:hypothetical protein
VLLVPSWRCLSWRCPRGVGESHGGLPGVGALVALPSWRCPRGVGESHGGLPGCLRGVGARRGVAVFKLLAWLSLTSSKLTSFLCFEFGALASWLSLGVSPAGPAAVLNLGC